jgi:hypothetical protein
MKTAAIVAALGCALVTLTAPAAAQDTREAVHLLLDYYERGDHAFTVQQLTHAQDLGGFARDVRRHASSWTTAAGANRLRARRLVAATLALEIATLRLWPEDVDPLIEFGCELMRRNGSPTDGERLWQLAAVAIHTRARDGGRVVTRGSPGIPVGMHIPPPLREVDHVAHARDRFPNEPRFRLAEAMRVAALGDNEPPRDADWVDDGILSRDHPEARRRARAREAIALFEPLVDDPAVGAEASMRLGYLRFTLHETEAALAAYARSAVSEDTFVGYLARFLTGRALDRLGRRDDANAQYRAALTILPRAQSASQALAANLFLHGDREEAYRLVQSAASLTPRLDDPWHQFGYGDLRLVPDRMARLREAIK